MRCNGSDHRGSGTPPTTARRGLRPSRRSKAGARNTVLYAAIRHTSCIARRSEAKRAVSTPFGMTVTTCSSRWRRAANSRRDTATTHRARTAARASICVIPSRRKFGRGEAAARRRPPPNMQVDLLLRAEEAWPGVGMEDIGGPPGARVVQHPQAEAGDGRLRRKGAAIEAARIGQHVHLQQARWAARSPEGDDAGLVPGRPRTGRPPLRAAALVIELVGDQPDAQTRVSPTSAMARRSQDRLPVALEHTTGRRTDMNPAQLCLACTTRSTWMTLDQFHHRGRLRPAEPPVQGDGISRRTRDRYADRPDRDPLAQGHGGVTRTAKRRS